eukprot:Phypoly_transcript_10016.p1 GENE.Phypoly_transcript_10016~~Phypoly_transcript_10016.p1  ORF type:complete len:346 (+),score=65.47 Phypoly_transcript_10016:277-1314(+)
MNVGDKDFMTAFLAMVNSSEYNMKEHVRTNNLPLPEITPQDLSGKIIIVTGANVGIGFETAKALAAMNPAKLILACRNLDKANSAKNIIEDATNFHSIEAWQLDLASFASTQAFAKKFNETGLPLDLLVSNAGVGPGARVQTVDGYEITVQVNHLCNALLVALLHPALQKAKICPEEKFPRVNLVASDTHFWAALPLPNDTTPVQTILTQQEETPLGVYPATKLMNILFAKAYALKCPDPVWIYSSNPGYTESELGAKDAATGEAGESHEGFMKKRTTYEGAKTIIETSVSPKVGPSGGYYSEMGEGRTRSSAQGESGERFAEHVWNDTLAILKRHVPGMEIYDW